MLCVRMEERLFLTAVFPPSTHHGNLLSLVPTNVAAHPIDCPQSPDFQFLARVWSPGLYQVRDRRVSADVKDGGAPRKYGKSDPQATKNSICM